MRDALDELTEAFESLLPRIIVEYGHGWVVFADSEHITKCTDFPTAARFARDNYGRRQVLIRHTDERSTESAPFIQVHAEG